MDAIDERLSRMEDLLHQLIGMVAKNNSAIADLKAEVASVRNGMADMESRLSAGIDGVEQRLTSPIEGMRRDVTVLQSESRHVAQSIGVLERAVAVSRSQA